MTTTYRPTDFAMHQYMHNYNVEMRNIAEIFLLIQSAVNSMALESINHFASAVLASATEEGRKTYGYARDYTRHGIKHDCEMLFEYIKQYDRHYAEVMKATDRCEDSMRRQVQMSDSLDESDGMLAPVIADLHEYFKRISSKGLTTPEDPQAVEDLLTCFVWIDLSTQLWRFACKKDNLPILTTCRAYDFMALDVFYNKMGKIERTIDFRDARTKGRMIYNKKGIMTADGMIQILQRIRNILFTSAFVDRMVIARGGEDPHLRDLSVSILDSGAHDNSIIVS